MGCWRSTGPTSLLKQGHLEQVAHGCVQTDFKYLQAQRLYHLHEQPVVVLGYPHSQKVFPDIQREPLLFQSHCL